MENRLITFRNGQQVCPLGQGTYQMGRRRSEEIQALRRGIELGLTLIDTAEMYGTEDLVGRARLPAQGIHRQQGVAGQCQL